MRAELLASGSGAGVRPRLLTVEQAATYVGRSEDAVRHMIHAGKIPMVRADRRFYLDVEDLNRWIESNKEHTT